MSLEKLVSVYLVTSSTETPNPPILAQISRGTDRRQRGSGNAWWPLIESKLQRADKLCCYFMVAGLLIGVW